MRNALVQALLKHVDDPRFVMLVGDLGYRCMEPLRDKLGDRFINCGIAEQNMIGVAAGLAKSGMRPWCYSIAPFIYARAFEFIRNDVCYHDLPVMLVGNGGGFAYGINGPTHHALEDYGILLTLPNIIALVPSFDSDIETIVDNWMMFGYPAYLRLGVDEAPAGSWRYNKFRRISIGDGPTILTIGPIAGSIFLTIDQMPNERRPSLWVASELPLSDLPKAFIRDVSQSGRLIVIEEHVQHGGLWNCLTIANNGSGFEKNIDVTHIYASGPPYESYGSQKFHRKQSGLDIDSIMGVINER